MQEKKEGITVQQAKIWFNEIGQFEWKSYIKFVKILV